MRLIDADALIEHAYWECFDNPDDDYQYVLKSDIDDAPTVDAVEVVRCGECIYYEEAEADAKVGTCLLTMAGAETNGFCSWGEREEVT